MNNSNGYNWKYSFSVSHFESYIHGITCLDLAMVVVGFV